MSQEAFQTFRKRFPVFRYHSFEITENDDSVELRFHFSIGGGFSRGPEIYFSPLQRIMKRNWRVQPDWSSDAFQSLVFHIGLVELISYWKATCSPTVVIEPFQMNEKQILWWKKLWFNGLGEFFFLNKIQTAFDDFLNVEFAPIGKNATPVCDLQPLDALCLVPIGGGKDSAVTLELLKNAELSLRPFIINPRGATLNTVKVGGFQTEDVLEIKRTIDPELINLNDEGFLNGHTPFSALVAFDSLLAAVLSGAKYIALSNEGSASEPTVLGTEVNHQYSKSLEFEADFRQYVSENFGNEIQYFSFLRPLSEFQIAGLLSKKGQKYLNVVRSCNAGSKTDVWCGNCPKCLFTYVMLSPYLSSEKLVEMFGKNLFEDENLQPIFDELLGLSSTKPFECVGTVEEVRQAAELTLNYLKERKQKLPVLIANFEKKTPLLGLTFADEMQKARSFTYLEHFLPLEFETILKNEMIRFSC